MNKENRINKNELMGFDIRQISLEEAKLYDRYLKFMSLINEHMPKHILDLKNKMKVKKFKREMNEIIDILAESGFWNKIMEIA